MQAVWPDSFVEEGNLTQNIHLLRKALGERLEEHRYVVTVPGKGYKFVASLKEISINKGSISQDSQGNADFEFASTTLKAGLAQAAAWLRSRLKIGKGWIAPLGLVGLILVICWIKALPPLARFYNNRGMHLQQEGQIQGAIQAYQQALRLESSYAAAHYNLANAYEEIPNYDKAMEEYQLAIDADLMFYPAYNNLSRLYILRRRDSGAALRLLDRALSLKPQEVSVQYSLYKNYGWASFELHNLGQAEQNLKFAVSLSPGRGAAHCLLAKVVEAQGTASPLSEWESCAAYSYQAEVEPEWRIEAKEYLGKQEPK